MALLEGASFTWLGHATLLVETAGGKRILVDPWVKGNPACPQAFKESLGRLDVILVTHAHFDHIGDALEVARTSGGTVVCSWELAQWFNSKGVSQVFDMNKGGTAELEGIKAHMVHADHSCGILDGGEVLYGGEACGWVVELENGTRFYHSGDTGPFGDMRLIGELYSPSVAFLPIDGRYNMGPVEAAWAARALGVTRVVPIHWGTFPILLGTPAQLREALKGTGIEVVELEPGKPA